LKDRNGRNGILESKGDLYAFTTGKFNSLQDRLIKRDETKYIQLKRVEKVQKETLSLDDLFIKTKWIGDIKTRFSHEVLEWYIIDHIMSPSDRLQHMINLDWDNPPIYAKDLKTKHLKILGSEKIYDKEFVKPIGKIKDEYEEWLNGRMENFIKNRNKYFATMEKQKILFNIDDRSPVLKKAERQKNISGRSCKSYPQQILNIFAEWIKY
jgi:hypothetical protein